MKHILSHSIPRRAFLRLGAAGVAAGVLWLRKGAHAGDLPRMPADWLERYASYRDAQTGVMLYNLTPGEHVNQVMYQTHPMWTEDMTCFLFYSDRSGNGMRPHLLHLSSGEVRPLLNQAFQRGTMTWERDRFYYMADHDVYELEVSRVFSGEAQPRRLGTVPEAFRRYSGDMTVDADFSALYFGYQQEEGSDRHGAAAFDLTTGETRIIVEMDFRVGHFQANPITPGLIMFCWETGGDAPQRTWLVNRDGSGLRPCYRETYNEWVTHEVWWGADRIVFTIWPYGDVMHEKPHGVAMANINASGENAPDILAQYPAWHTHGSNDRKWVLGDDFDRNIWLINMASRERKLLTQGHNGAGFKTHPHASFTPDNGGLVFNSSRNGFEQIFYTPLPEWETLT